MNTIIERRTPSWVSIPMVDTRWHVQTEQCESMNIVEESALSSISIIADVSRYLLDSLAVATVALGDRVLAAEPLLLYVVFLSALLSALQRCYLWSSVVETKL